MKIPNLCTFVSVPLNFYEYKIGKTALNVVISTITISHIILKNNAKLNYSLSNIRLEIEKYHYYQSISTTNHVIWE